MKKIAIYDYFDLIPPILLDCQFIEEMLRMYISNSYEIIKKKLNKSIPFKFSYADLKSDNLGVIIKKFKKLNNNKDLIKNVEIVRKHRNFCVHQAYLLTYEEQKDELYLRNAIKELSQMKAKVKSCLVNVINELEKIENIKNNLTTQSN